MTKHRKFNSEQFFRGFHGHENELHELFTAHGVEAPDVLEVDSFYTTLIRRPNEEVEDLLFCLHELNDLSSKEGREILEQACVSMHIAPPEEDVCNPRAACQIHLHHRDVFDHAMELLAVRSIQSCNVAMFPGREATPIDDPQGVANAMARLLRAPLRAMKKTEALEVRQYFDGDIFVVVVFCERHAEVHLEFGANTRHVMSRVRRPADQYVLLYHQSTGHLEIEGARAKERAMLRSAFAEAAFDDNEFFPESEDFQLLDLDHLIESGFRLPTRTLHTARITGLKLVGVEAGRKFVCEFSIGRRDLMDALQRRGMLDGALAGASVQSVRIELLLDFTRAGRKSIVLKGTNSIQFNRTSYSDAIYDYLRNWGLMQHGVASPNLV